MQNYYLGIKSTAWFVLFHFTSLPSHFKLHVSIMCVDHPSKLVICVSENLVSKWYRNYLFSHARNYN